MKNSKVLQKELVKITRVKKERFLEYILNLEMQETSNNQEPVFVFLQTND